MGVFTGTFITRLRFLCKLGEVLIGILLFEIIESLTRVVLFVDHVCHGEMSNILLPLLLSRYKGILMFG